MSKMISIATLMVVGTMAAQAALYTYTYSDNFANGGNIPDGNASGWSDERTSSGIADSRITDVNVTLNISGGYNADMYGYLSYRPANGSGSGFSVLLNRVGVASSNPFGYGDAGLIITLNDQAAQTTDIHFYQTVGGYSITDGAQWRPDGRDIDPLSVGPSFDSASRTALLSSFNDLNPNGSWTLFFADVSGGAQSTVLSWGLQIEAIPEPMEVALAIFVVLVVGVRLFCCWRCSRTGRG